MIKLLDNNTIDKIAAGEVVERPSSVVKELVENAIDAGAISISIEIKNGGIDLIRVTDDGKGIPKDQLRTAFLRHATSKIQSEEDLSYLTTLGFRGEALPSIASVSQVEIITKTSDSMSASRMRIDGGVEKEFDDVGAPDGTTIIARNIFFNVPVRKKFLKSPQTEAAAISDLIEKLALSNPYKAFKLTINNIVKLQTKGNGDLKEVIYKIYGRQTVNALIPVSFEGEGITINGYLAKPEINNGTRDGENYYINNRFIKSDIISKAIEEGYREFMMQHRFPFCVLHLDIDTTKVDVNVHPTKMDVRIVDAYELSSFITDHIKGSLSGKELIPAIKLEKDISVSEKLKGPEPFESNRIVKESNIDLSVKDMSTDFNSSTNIDSSVTIIENDHGKLFTFEYSDDINEDTPLVAYEAPKEVKAEVKEETVEKASEYKDDFKQTNLFEEKILVDSNINRIKVIGQLFDTYWLIEFDNQLYMLDQHAAHEKIKYEEFIKKYHEKQVISQNLIPAHIINLSNSDMALYLEYSEYFKNAGFEIEEFGSNELYIVAVPVDFYNSSIDDIFFSILNELKSGVKSKSVVVIEENIATMACKAAVKGNNKLSQQEVKELLNKLLECNNPYNCPHGRPTMITFTKYEIEKKFKRIV